ncbi:MAG: autotransporter-associated beta strand repeat-containing protein [Chitinophagaceae bacterium]|nr:autotransporter-associated beta strand repeat-containing protein [Chitinophagaceae bacterium]
MVQLGWGHRPELLLLVLGQLYFWWYHQRSAGAGLTIASISTGKIVLTNAANTYSGPTIINSGILQAGVNNCLPANTPLVLANNATATFNGNGFNTTVGSIAGGGATPGNITMGAGNLSTGGANTFNSYGGVISGSGTFTKTGTGTQFLTGANTYTGITTVSGGGLFINGSTNSLSAATVSAGATLGGNGTVAGTVSNSGILSPGSGAATTGTLNTGAVTFASNSTYKFEVSNVAGTQGAVSGWDFLNSSGAITVSASPINIDLTGIAGNGFNNNNAYTWVIATGSSIVGFNPANFTVTPTGFIGAGTFSIEQSGNSLQIVHTPPSGNSISLSPASQLAAASFCNGVSNNIITLTYVTSGTVTAPAIELSDASGSFLSGTVQLSGTVSGGPLYSITGTIPGGQTASANYLVRIISADAIPVISANNLNNITITDAVVPSVSIAITSGTNPACAGTSVTFTATPTNGGAPGYQWKKNGVDIGGETAVTYTTSTLSNGDIITCVMTPSGSCVTAATAVSGGITMTINPLPATPSNPVAAGVNPSCGANSLNSMSSDPNTDFYWQGTVLNGQSTVNATTANYPVAASGTYYVTSLSNDGCWSAGSGSIVITVSTAPSISVQPADKIISANTNTSFSVTAANASGFQWQVDQGSGFADVINGGVYAGATTNTLTLTAVPIGYTNYVYQCIVRGGGCADLVSAPATLTVNAVPWEDFETGSKAGYAIANVTCTAGSWSFNNALLGTSASDNPAGLQAARIEINGDITMNFNLASLGVVKLSHRVFGSDNNSTWQLQASTDNGATWSAFTSAIFTSTTTIQTETILVNIAGSVRFRILNKETSGTNQRINIDDIYVTTYNGCTTPTSQATFTSVTLLTSTTMTINFAAGTGGNGRIVVVKQGSPVAGFPISGTPYVPLGSNFSALLPTIATGEKVVYNGAGTSVSVNGLTPNTTYYFEIFEYATAGTCYLLSNVSNTGVATTACNTPTVAPSAVNPSAVTSTTATIGWTAGNGTNTLVVVNAGSAVTGTPVNGTGYSVNSSYSVAPAFAPGTGKTVYNSTSTSVSLTNLASNTVYYVSVFTFNNTTNCYLSTVATTTFTTGSLLSDIISADGESSCISSVVNGPIATVANGTQVWQFTVRDGGASAPDADGLPTIVNSIVITQGTSNTVADWTNIEAAALFDGATLISAGVITATNITFTGAPLISVADNTDKTLSLRITLKNPVTIPNTIDGKLFRFSISEGNITLAGSGTSGKNTSAAVATTDITKDVVCVVATKLVFTTQPSNTGQNQSMSPSVVVTAYDANNNIDLDFTQVVSITASGGGLIGSPKTATAIAGKATFTGIKHSIIGAGYIMTATSAPLTNAVSASYDITTYTTFAPGDFAILAVNNNNTNSVDEIAFVVFNNIVTNTEFYMTDNGYERVSAGKWGTTEGVVRLKYIGVPTIPAGTIFVIQGNDNSFTMLRCGLNDNANWTITPHVLYGTANFNLNAEDQVWFSQGGSWTSAISNGHDATTDGRILYGWTGVNWKANIGNTPITWTTKGSRLYPQMSCFSTNLNLLVDPGKTKYTGDLVTPATRLGWIARINNSANWATYASNALYDGAAVNYATGTHCNLTITPGVPVDGKWTGTKNVDWFDCNNWDTREIPNAAISVTIDNSATNNCVVDNVTYAANATQYGNSADCFNLTVDNKSLSTGNAADVINVNGNFVLNNGAALNMTGGGTFNLQSGSWTKTASTFTSGTGTVSYNSAASQTIAAENYFNLVSSSTGDRDMSTAGTIGIAGTFTKGTNLYTFTNSTVDYNGSGAQSITAFTAATTPGYTYNNLTLSNTGIKSLSGETDVENALSINNSVTLALGNNFLNLKSTATNTARVAPVSAAANITYGTGKFVVERYFPPRRAWRLITAPVTVDATKTLFNSWQVGGASPIGVGTYISGPNETVANGLDVTVQHNFSLKTFNQLTSAFDGVGDTKANRISGTAGVAGSPDNIGYFMFVRGDRTPANVDAFNPNGTVVETTLKDTGMIQVQSYTFNANPSAGINKYAVIGNPYASPVDFALLGKSGVANKFQAWDPNLNTVGGYVVFDMALGSPVPASTQTQIIQSKQAIVVETNVAGSPTVTFNEASKSSTNNLTLFRPQNRQNASLAANIFTVNADGSTILADGALAEFNSQYSNDADQLDALKFTNINETFSIVNKNNYFILERRPLLKANDTMFFSFKRTRQLHYRFNVTSKRLAERNLAGYLEDSYLKTSTPVNMNGDTWVDFEVNGDAGSAAANRFYIVFKKAVRFHHIHADMVVSDVLVNWSMENEEEDINRYEVERSSDGVSFENVGTTLAKGGTATTAAYNSLDIDPAPGIYYYRIKGISNSGAFDYTEAVKVKVAKTKSQLYVYPNPVTDGSIGLQMNTMPAGIYNTRLLNAAGQPVLKKQIVHAKTTATEMIVYPSTLTAGTYQLEVVGPDKKTSFVSVMIVCK